MSTTDLAVVRDEADDVIEELELLVDALLFVKAGKADGYHLNTLRGHLAGDGALRLEFVLDWEMLLAHAQEARS